MAFDFPIGNGVWQSAGEATGRLDSREATVSELQPYPGLPRVWRRTREGQRVVFHSVTAPVACSVASRAASAVQRFAARDTRGL